MSHIHEHQHRFPFPTQGQPAAVILWASNEKSVAIRENEDGFSEVHVRWNADELADCECDDPHALAQRIVNRVWDSVKDQRSLADVRAVEHALCEWLMEHRSAAALRDHGDSK